ncbi:Alanine and proline rich membrane protein [Mycobacterium simiae]
MQCRASTDIVNPERYAPCVSNQPPPPPHSPSPWAASPPAPARRSSSLAIASFVAALIAVVVAIGSWLRPMPDNKQLPVPSPPVFTEQQTSEAKTKVCATYQKVHQAVLINTGRSGGTDPIALLGVAANARLALYDGGEYLLKSLADNPATPPQLAMAVRQLADSYQQLAVNYMAEVSQSDIDSSLHAGDKPNATIYDLCK